MVTVSHSSKAVVDEARWRILALLSIAIVLSMTTWFSTTAIAPELKSIWSLDDDTASWLTTAVQLGFVVGALGASLFNLPDLVSARVLMTISAVLASVVNLSLLAARTPDIAILFRFMTGVALAGIYPPALKLVSTWFIRGRGLALGCVIAALTLGSAFPHLLRAITLNVDWKLVVGVTSAMTAVGALLLACFAVEGPYAYSRSTFDPRQIGRVLRSKSVMLANVGYLGHMWELYAMWGWFLAFTHAALNAHNFDSANASLITFTVIGVGTVGCILGGALADRIGRTATTSIMMAISGLCTLVIGFTFEAPLWAFIIVSIVWGITIVGDSAQFSAIITEVGEASFIGTALALQLGLGFALTAVAIRSVPLMAEYLGWQWSFVILFPGPLVGVIAMLMLRSSPQSLRIAHGRK